MPAEFRTHSSRFGTSLQGLPRPSPRGTRRATRNGVMRDGSAVSFSSTSSEGGNTTKDGDDVDAYGEDSFVDDVSIAENTTNSDEDAYADESFVADDGGESMAQHDSTPVRTDSINASDGVADTDGYGDESFEGEDDNLAADGHESLSQRKEEEYSADFCDSEQDPDDGSRLQEASSDTQLPADNDSASTDAAHCRRPIWDQSTQHPSEDLDAVAKEWATRMVKKLQGDQRTSTRRSHRQLTHNRLQLDAERLASEVLRRVQQRRPAKHPKPAPNRMASVPVPAALLELARLRRAVAVTAAFPPPEAASRPDARSLSTFLVTKTADLEGKLATQRLDDLCSRWQTSGDSYSVAVLEFMATATRRQREMLRDDSSGRGGTVLSSLKTHATDLDRAAQTAQNAILDSQSLREQAGRLLRAHDARPCTCDFSTCS